MNLHFREATAAMVKTYPFVLLRMAVALLFSVAIIALVTGSIWLGTTVGSTVGLLAGILGVLAIIGVYFFVKPYLLYLVEGAHVAVLTAIIEDGKTPENQFRYGKEQVRSNFASVSVLFVIDRAIKRLLKQLNSLIDTMINSVSSNAPGSSSSKQGNLLEGVMEIVKLTLNITIGYVDKAIMANIFRSDHENNWKPAKDGVVQYAKTWKPILLSTVTIVTIVYGPFVIAGVFHEELLAALGGEEAVLSHLEAFVLGFSDAGLILLVTAAVTMVFIVQFGIVSSWLTALILTIYLSNTEPTTTDSEWEDQLREHSDEFREFERRAEDDSDVEPKTGTWRDYFLPDEGRDSTTTA